ncbi:EPIDERMAL PATTERNING FACTOR-like protein 1 [Phragmites australis]|uniref:EPIDERMAL PATTERNING FACTOR-like protein 1 n=1 Tax=Phragmites australis TaxID=29695 RepID=UPI002D79EAB8|nr:EPIDERMAL PATTERNING FACTOR-like protein 1 [Phragmites australis]
MRPAATPLLLTVAVFSVAILGLLPGATGLPRLQPPSLSSPLQGGGVAGEEMKVRLGSSPPNCRGKCYECSPCTAVQVPTLSGPSGPAAARGERLRPRPAGADVPLVSLSSSNYKPVGWKCQCRDRQYEP